MASAQRCCALQPGHARLLDEATRNSHRRHTGAAYVVAMDADDSVCKLSTTVAATHLCSVCSCACGASRA